MEERAGDARARARDGAASDDELAAARAYVGYGEALAAWQAVDFDDLIAMPVALFERDADVLARWQSAVRARAGRRVPGHEPGAVPAVPASRRRARAASPRSATTTRRSTAGAARRVDNLAQLPNDYPGAQGRSSSSRTIARRSASCARANALIANNPKLFDKRLWSELGHGDTIRVTAASDDEAESRAGRCIGCSRTSSSIAAASPTTRSSIAATTRRACSRRRCARRTSPTRSRAGQSYFEKSEIKDIVAYLRLLVNDDDDPAFIRAVTTPRRGIGQTTLKKLSGIAGARRESLFAAAFSPELPRCAHEARPATSSRSSAGS